MPWLLASPGHQQPWYWSCRIGRSLSYSGRNFNYLCQLPVLLVWRNDIKCKYMFMFSLKNLARKGLRVNGFEIAEQSGPCLPYRRILTTRVPAPPQCWEIIQMQIYPCSFLNQSSMAKVNTLRQRQKGCYFPEDILKSIFLMKTYKFWLRFHWSLVLRVQLAIFQHWSDNGLALSRWQAIIWTNDGLFTDVYFASLGLNELNHCGQVITHGIIKLSQHSYRFVAWRC